MTNNNNHHFQKRVSFHQSHMIIEQQVSTPLLHLPFSAQAGKPPCCLAITRSMPVGPASRVSQLVNRLHQQESGGEASPRPHMSLNQTHTSPLAPRQGAGVIMSMENRLLDDLPPEFGGIGLIRTLSTTRRTGRRNNQARLGSRSDRLIRCSLNAILPLSSNLDYNYNDVMSRLG
jgi:hypothetical protein